MSPGDYEPIQALNRILDRSNARIFYNFLQLNSNIGSNLVFQKASDQKNTSDFVWD